MDDISKNGIARRLEARGLLSRKSWHVFMAPEVYKGEVYSAAVDIFSLGMVLYHLLNNNRGPFMPPYPEKIRYSDRERAYTLLMSGNPIPLPGKAKGRLGEIILKACAYEPDKRYESATAMRKALESVSLVGKEDSETRKRQDILLEWTSILETNVVKS